MKCPKCDSKDSLKLSKIIRRRGSKEKAIIKCEECGHRERFGTVSSVYERKRK